MMILLAFGVQADGKDLVEKLADMLVDQLAEKLVDMTVTAWPLPHAHWENLTLGKPGNFHVAPRSARTFSLGQGLRYPLWVPSSAPQTTLWRINGRRLEESKSAAPVLSARVAAARAGIVESSLDFHTGLGEAAAQHVTGGMQIVLVPCLSDNYAPLLHDPTTGATAVVDTPEAGPIARALKDRGWRLTHILNTHHHWDHTGANLELKKQFGCEIVGPAAEAKAIPGIDQQVAEGDEVRIGSFTGRVLDVGGHTLGHIAYHFPNEKALFAGDALFTLGCGRMFEGTFPQFWTSLSKLRDLPDDTVFYCAHEYTASNARFATSVDPNGADLQRRVEVITKLRDKNMPTVPSLLGHEKLTNPFLRAGTEEMRESMDLPLETQDVQVFAALRRAKDNFKR